MCRGSIGGSRYSDFCLQFRCVGVFCDVGAPHLKDIFYRMGLSDKEIVALSGAHTLVSIPHMLCNLVC
jgi:hypothetical protein